MRIGIDLGGTKIEAILLTRDGREQARIRTPTPQGDYTATIQAVAGLVQQLEIDLDQTPTVGIGIPGTICETTKLVKNANSVCLIGQALDQNLAKILNRPVRVANDANCFALSEAYDGAASGAQVVFGVILGTGVGGAIVMGGKAISGANLIAGEWGHNPLPWPQILDEGDERPGPECYCGQSGCVETFLSGPGLCHDHHKHTQQKIDPKSIVAFARGGDENCEATMKRYEHRLARALAVVINIVDPDVIVFGGGLSNVSRLYENVPVLLPRWVFSDTLATKLTKNKHGDSSGVRGAAWLWP